MTTGKNKDYNRIKLRLSLADIALNLFMLACFSFTETSIWISYYVRQYFSGEYLQFMLFAAVVGMIISIVSFPLDFYGGFIVEHRYGLSNQSIFRWIFERIKSSAVGLVIGVPLALTFYFALRSSGHLWWLYFSIFVFFFSVILARIAPVVIFPLFYKFRELEDGEVKEKIMSLMKSQKITIKGIYSFNMSRDTKKANAAFAGLGKTKRIILGDTLLEKFTPDEIAVVFAHEIGHYRRKHIVKNLFTGAFIILFSFYFCGYFYEKTLAHIGFRNVYEIAAIPVLLFYLSILGILIMPLSNFISRIFEREADRFALETTKDKNSFISAMTKLSEMNLSDKDPHPLEVAFFYSHPPVAERISFAEKFRPST